MNCGYIAITDICNYKCGNCPYKSNIKKFVEYDKIKAYIDENDNDMQTIVLSGGEPTLHPDFFKILKYLDVKGKYVTILSNGSRLSNNMFVKGIKDNIDVRRLNIVMTIYNVKEKKHDEGTGIIGSFENTLQAFEILNKNNIKVTLKHCISKENYKDLSKFFIYFDKKLPTNISFQLTTLDFSGMNQKQIRNNCFTYSQIKKYMDKALKKFNKERNLIIVNTPFCAVNSKYWNYIVKKQNGAYKGYKSIKSQNKDVDYDCACFSKLCQNCKMNEICPGTYRANYEFVGDKLVAPIIK